MNTFAATEPELVEEIEQNKDGMALHVERNPTVLEIQAIPEKSESYVNTERFTYLPVGMLHLEGGWPKDVDPTEKDQTQRYKKKVEKDEEYIKQIKTWATPSRATSSSTTRSTSTRSTSRASTRTTRASRRRRRRSPSSKTRPRSSAPSPTSRGTLMAARSSRSPSRSCSFRTTAWRR